MRWNAPARSRPKIALASPRLDQYARGRAAIAAAVARRRAAGENYCVEQVDVEAPEGDDGLLLPVWLYFADESCTVVTIKLDRPLIDFDHWKIRELLC